MAAAGGGLVTRPIFDALKAIAAEAVTIGADGLPRVAPESVEATANVMGEVNQRGWRVRIEGRASWMPPDAPADLAITTERLNRIISVAPADLVASAQSGVPLRSLRTALGHHRAWVPIDPPGSPDRTLGSVLATGTAGPLRHRFGPIRDQVLGTTVVTGDGRVIRSGGLVVKNVAGFDLTKVQIGGFGAFGIITEVHLRVRALPASRVTLLGKGSLETLLDASRAINDARPEASLLELLSPALSGSSEWLLITQALGTAEGARAASERIIAAGAESELRFEPVEPLAADRLLSAIGEAMIESPVVVRAGVLAPSTPDLVDLIGETIGHGRLAASLGVGGLRWAGNPTPAHLRALRIRLAEREIPLTLERAPWGFRRAVGHFGAFREGVAPLTERVRAVFDPGRRLVAPLEAADVA
jgi:glycolate oxidase FAD binding subunit